MTIKKQQVWRVVIDTATYSNTSKEKVLSLANSSIEKQEMLGLPWELQQVWVTPRTKPLPIVLVIGSGDITGLRPADKWVEKFSREYLSKDYPPHTKSRLICADSSGTRSVFWYTTAKAYYPNYGRHAEDLPQNIFEDLAKYLEDHGIQVHLYLRCKDTGVGIVLKEDNPENGFSFRQENPIEKVINNIAPAPLPKPIEENS